MKTRPSAPFRALSMLWAWTACVPFLAVLAMFAQAAELPLVVGTSGDYRPFSAGAPPEGFDIDIARRLAHDLSRSPSFVLFRWPTLREDLAAGRFEVAASGVTIRPDRLLVGRFTRPYVVSGAVVLFRAADAARFSDPSSFDRDDLRLVVNRGGYLESVARSRFGRTQIVPVDDNESLGTSVASSFADLALTDTIEAPHFLEASPNLRVGAPLSRDYKALLVGRGQKDLFAAIDAWMSARESDGWLDGERRRLLGAESAMSADESALEAVSALVEQRLSVMPMVAASKRAKGLPIEDPAQETRVLGRARDLARAAALSPAAVEELFRRLISISKAVQTATRADAPAADLTELRAIIGELSERLVLAIAMARGPLRGGGAVRSLADRLEQSSMKGVPSSAPGELAEAIVAAAR